MKKTLTLFISALLIGTSSHSLAQAALSFDPQFNSGTPHSSTFNYVYHNNSGRMRQLNDSMYVYFKSTNNGTDLIQSDVFGKIIHASGAVTEFVVFSQTDTTNQFADYKITDLITNGSDGSFFIIKNKGGYEVKVTALICNPALLPANPWSLNTSFGTAGTFTIGTTISLSEAMGVYTSNGLVLFAHKPGMSKTDLYRIILDDSNGGSFSEATITSAGLDEYHRIRDVIAINDTTFAVADDFHDYNLNTTTSWYEFTIQPRVWKVTLSNNTPGFTAVGVNYTSNFEEKNMNRIFFDSQGKLWVLGTNKIAGQFGWSYRGYVKGFYNFATTVSSQTTAISPAMIGSSTTYSFTDIKESPFASGEYLLSGSADMGMVARFIPDAPDGATITPVFISNTTLNLYSVNWIYCTPSSGGNASNSKVVFNSGNIVPVLGRLIPSAPLSVEMIEDTHLLIYPNPMNNQLQIQSSENTEISIRSLDGSLLYKGTINGEATIDVSNFASGIYFVQTANGTTYKVIKN